MNKQLGTNTKIVGLTSKVWDEHQKFEIKIRSMTLTS